jgi:hypothetical protein
MLILCKDTALWFVKKKGKYKTKIDIHHINSNKHHDSIQAPPGFDVTSLEGNSTKMDDKHLESDRDSEVEIEDRINNQLDCVLQDYY